MTQTRSERNSRLSISDSPGVKECKEPCTRAIAFAGTALAGALDVGILLTRCKATWIAHTISRDELTRMRHPLGARVPSELHKCSVRHHIMGRLAPRVTRFVHESWLPMVVGTQAHLNTPSFCLTYQAEGAALFAASLSSASLGTAPSSKARRRLYV